MINLRLRVTSADLIVNEKRNLRKFWRQVGAEVAGAARAKLRGVGGGRIYAGHQASAPGQAPARLTGTLARSIVVRPFKSGEGVAIRSTDYTSLFLEHGAVGGGGKKGSRNKRGRASTQRVLLPRPFLSAALDDRSGSLTQRVRDAFLNDLAFKRVKR